MSADNEQDQQPTPPRTPEEFGDWFANASEDERRRFADFHGDATAHNRTCN